MDVGKTLPPGSYRVEIYWSKPTGKKLKDPDLGETLAQVIPPTYNKNSTLKADIKSAANTFNYELKSK